MLRNKKHLLLTLFIGLFALLPALADVTGLLDRYLEKANTEYENGNLENAYKYINQAMSLSKNEENNSNVLYFAQTIYTKRLEKIKKDSSYINLVEIQANLEQYPEIQNATIKKLVAQIQAQQQLDEEKAKKAEADAIKAEQKKQFTQQMQLLQEQSKAQQQQTKAQQEQARIQQEQAKLQQQQSQETVKTYQELKETLTTGLGEVVKSNNKNAEATGKSVKSVMIVVIAICIIILVIVAMIILIVRAGFKHQQVQQQQYVEAFKLLAANQTQTNKLMLGGVTDIYGTNGVKALKSAGSSRWGGLDALPEPEETPEEKTEMRELAAKCEDLGVRIDQATNRKNNSKNVSELVYKLAMKLGLHQHEAMVYFCAAMVYDSGFLAIDSELLSADVLSSRDKMKLKRHVDQTDDYLQFVPKRYWQVFSDASTKHHENMDGSGYPEGLKGDEIPQVARLIRVAETFISLSSKRNYHEIADKETAVAKMKEQPQFYDPDVVGALEEII